MSQSPILRSAASLRRVLASMATATIPRMSGCGMFWQEAQKMTHGESPCPTMMRLRQRAFIACSAQHRQSLLKILTRKNLSRPLRAKLKFIQARLPHASEPDLPPLPTYITHGRAAMKQQTGPYPLQLISTHSKRRIHSNMHTSPWLRDLEPHTVWINPADAGPRGIKNGDMREGF